MRQYIVEHFQATSVNKKNNCQEEKLLKDLPRGAGSAEGNVSMSHQWTISWAAGLHFHHFATCISIIVTGEKKKTGNSNSWIQSNTLISFWLIFDRRSLHLPTLLLKSQVSCESADAWAGARSRYTCNWSHYWEWGGLRTTNQPTNQRNQSKPRFSNDWQAIQERFNFMKLYAKLSM